MGYPATTTLVIYWKPDSPHNIHWNHHDWFDGYNFKINYTEKHTPSYPLLNTYVSKDIQVLYFQSNISSFDIKLAQAPFVKYTLINYIVLIPLAGNKIGLNILD